jgi:DNA-binding IclR family transcriptional regulator
VHIITEISEVSRDAVPEQPRRSSSARAVLQALALLARSPDGLRADQTARALGRSVSTAYSLLDSLCQEGFAVHEERGAYRLAATGDAAVPRPERAASASLTALLDELYVRTNKRAYLAASRHGTLVIAATRGRQGMRRMRGLGRQIDGEAHALALGKVALAMRSADALEAYLGRGLRRFTPHTIVDGEALLAELAAVRRDGLARELEEYEPDFCGLAAPVRDGAGRAVAVLGVSMSRRSHTQERDELEATLLDVVARLREREAGDAETALPENAMSS